MIPWLLVVERDVLGGGHDACCGVGTHQAGPVLRVRFDGLQIEHEVPEQGWVEILPGQTLDLPNGRFSVVIGRIDDPAPPPVKMYRLPGGGPAEAALLVQNGKFRGCFFAVGTGPCWLGQGASVRWEQGAGVLLESGSEAVDVSGRSVAPSGVHTLAPGDVVTIGERRYQLLTF
jgi:hypothetical protein